MRKGMFGLMAGVALVPAVAFAQDTGKESARKDTGEIIVTAQRYSQRLQDVPLSITAVSAKELAARGVTDIRDLQYAVPGFSTVQYGIGRQSLQLRGISSTQGASTIGVYLDETPLALDTVGDAIPVRMLDLERVEVLRGPQATLYGQGSMGGTIRYIPAAPNLGTVSGSAEGEFSGTRDGGMSYRTVGVLNLPLVTDKLGLRIVGGYERIGGFIDSEETGQKDINKADVYTVRGTLLARPTDRLSISIMGLYQKSDQPNQDFGIDRHTSAMVPTPSNDRYTLVQGKISEDLDFAELSASASYIDRTNLVQNDISPFFVPVLGSLGLPPGFIDRVGLTATTDYRILNGEVRLASQGQGPFGWQVGATYRDLKMHQFGGSFTAPGTLPFAIDTADDRNRDRSYALYAEGRYQFTSKLTATLGLRYFHENKQRNVTSANFGVITSDVGDGDFHTLNPRFNLAYAFTPTAMAYANIAKGFRSGGFNRTSAGADVVAVPPTYKPDVIWTYEIGAKKQFLGGKLTLDASVYRTDWTDVQSTNFAPGSVVSIIDNSGKASGWGVDLSATARPTKTLTLTATYGWNNIAYDRMTADKQRGDPVDGAVRQSWSVSADFRPPLTDKVTGLFRIDYQHAGKAQYTLRNFPTTPVIPLPARDLVNLRIGATFSSVEVSVFANNLFDENVPLIVGPFSVIAEDLEQRPRVIGVSASTHF